jgi:hypothetical protein
MATLFSASTLGAPDLFELHNQTAAYWARHIFRLVDIRLRRVFSLYSILFRCAARAPFELARGWYFQRSRAAPGRSRRRQRPGVDSVHGEFKVMAARSGRAAK